MSITGQPGNAQAGQSISGPPAVRLTDSGGNPVPGTEVTVTEQSGQSFESGQTSVSTDEDGFAVFDDLVITVAGRYNLVFSASGVSNLTSNAFDVTPAEADPENSEANVPNGSAGDATQITITVRDAFGNRVEGVAGDLTVTVSGGPNTGATVSSISDEGEGVYTTVYSPVQTGDDEITIELGGIEIQGSPYTSSVITSDADEITVEQQPQQTVAGQPVQGPPSVGVVDDLGNPVEGVEVNVSISGSQEFGSGSTQQFTNSSGIAVFDDLVINSAGTYNLVFNAVGVSDDVSSDPFDVVAADASDLTIVSGNNQTGTVGQELADPLLVRVQDAFGNPVSGHSVEFEIDQVPGNASGQSLSDESTVTDASGEVSTQLTLGNRPGNYTVNASAGAAGVVVLTATASAGPADSFEFDTISSPQTAGESFGISITALDEFDNVADSYNGSAQLSTTAGNISPTSVSFNNGEASESVTVSEAGTSRTITATDGNTTGTSNEFDVESGGVSASESSVSAEPTTLTVGENSTISIQLRDGAGNPVSGLANQDFNISVSGNGDAISVSESTTAGMYTFEVLNERAETVTVIVIADGVELNDQPSVTFEAGPADPTNTTATVPDGTAGNETIISITVLDQYDNPVSGAAGNLSVVISGENSATPSVSESSTAGEYTASYTPTTAGSDQVAISLNGTPISGSPYTSTVTTSDISASNSSVTADPETLQVGINSVVTVELRDDNNNLIGGLAGDINVSVSGNGTAGPVSEESSGIYEFTVSNNTAQTVTVTVDVDGLTLQDTPQITFEPASVDAIVIQVHPGQSVAGEPIAGPPTVRLLDSNDNRVPGVEITVTEQGGQTVLGDVTLESDSQGEAVFNNIWITQSGSFNLVFTTSGETETSNAFIVDSADPDPAETTANVPNGSAGDATNIIITVRDEYGNRVEGVAGELSVTIQGENAGASVEPISDEGNGNYSTSYTPTSIGEDQVVIELGGAAIQESPYVSIVSTSDAENVSIEQQPLETVAGEAIQGPPSVFVDDGLGNPVSGIEVAVSEQGGYQFDSGTTSVETNGNGIAVFSDLVINTAENYTLVFDAVGVGNDAISSAFNVIPAAVSSGQSSVSVDPSNLSVGETSTLTIQVRDAFDNEIEGLTDNEISIVLSGEAETSGTLNETSAGTYQIGITNDSAETVTVTITADGITLEDQPSIEFQAGAASEMSVFTQPSTTTAGTAISPAPSVEVTDGTNPVSGVEVTVILSSNDFTGSSTITVPTDGSGIAEFPNLVIEIASTGYTLTFDADAAGVANVDSGPFEVTAAAASALNRVSGSEQSAQINQTLSEPFVVEVVDDFGNPVSGETVSFTIVTTPTDAGGQSLSAASVNTDATGQAESTLTLGDKVGTYGVDANWSTQTVNFTADAESADADAGNSTISANPESGLTADGTDTSTLTITVRDGGGNLLDGEDVFFAITAGTGGTLSASPWTTGGNGQATATLTSVDANTITVTGYLGTDETGTVVGTAEVVFVDNSVFSLTDPGQQTAGEEFNLAITDAQDVSGESLNGSVNVVVTSSVDGEVFGDPITFTDGSASVPVTLNTADDHTLTVNVDGVSNEEDIQVTVVAGDPEAITISDIVDPVLVNQAFDVTFTIHDSNQNTITDFNGNILLEVEFGEITPEEISLNPSNDGEVTEPIVLNTAGNNQMITAILQNDSEVIGESNIFEVTEE
jgi:hypothetical protein